MRKYYAFVSALGRGQFAMLVAAGPIFAIIAAIQATARRVATRHF
jgi:hypothetical protein